MKSPQKRILIIDDEMALRHSLSKVLATDGYLVKEAGSIKEGIACIQEGGLDLVFLDMHLPDGSGTVVFPQIQDLHPDLPVIVLTGHATLETAIEAVRQGARDYLLKPVEPELILSRTKAILSKQNLPQKHQDLATQIQALVQELRQFNADDKAPETDLMSRSSTEVALPDRYLRSGSLTLDLLTRQAMVGSKAVVFSSTTFEFLVVLAHHAPNVVSHQALVREAQGFEVSRAEALDICRWQIHEIRKGLEENPPNTVYIVTERGMGYRLAG